MVFRNGSFWIKVSFRQSRFTDKIQIRAHTLDDLIGASGGYIGLFLGYALIQVPQFMEFAFHKIKREAFTRKSYNIN